jgi:transposase
MIVEVRGGHTTRTAALNAVAEKLSIGSRETLLKWIKQGEVDSGKRPRTTTEESAQFKALKKRTPN